MLLLRQLTIIIFLAFSLSGCIEIPGAQSMKTPDGIAPSTEAFFCPHDECEQRIVSALGSAKNSVDAAIYSFTSLEITSALAKAHGKGARVRVVVDAVQAESENSVLGELERKGFEVRVFPKGTTMHNKFAVIDNSLVITGSYNWTKSAAYYNRENIIIIHDRTLAEKYGQEFFRLWVEAG